MGFCFDGSFKKYLPAAGLCMLLGGLAGRCAFAQSTDSQNTPAAQQQPVASFEPDTPAASHAAADLRVFGPNPKGWLFPITQLDEKLPRWFQFGGQFRDRWEDQDGIGYGTASDGYDLTQLRIGLYIQPNKWIKLVGVTQDSRVFFNQVHIPSAPPYQNRWDVREAYLELGNSTEGFFDFVVGREMFSFGDERVIGPSDWLNMGRTFDTLRADLHGQSWVTSLFAASVINAIDGQIDHHIEGNNLYGAYNSFRSLVPKAVVEPYLLWRVAPGNVKLSETQGHGHMDEVTGGARIAGKVGEGLDYDVEMNKQTGSLGRYTIDAWGGHWNAGYTFEHEHIAPRIYAEYNYASGNKSLTGDTWSTHDQLYPSAHDKMDFADQFGWRNIEDLRTGVMEKIVKKWTLTQGFDDIWLASKTDAIYGTNGAVAVAADPRATSTHVGTELDLVAQYKPDKHITYAFGYARIFPGTFLDEATKGHDYNYPFTYITYVF